MSLNKRLKFLGETMWRNAGPEAEQTRALALANQSQFATEEGTILKAPGIVPDAALVTGDGNTQSLRDLIAGKPAVLLFFRGSWCPYSTTSMRAYEPVRADLAQHGIAMIGITPQRHITLAAAIARNALGYPLLTDPDEALAEAMGIRIPIIPEMIDMYECQGYDLAKLNESGDWSLPLEATFLCSDDGRIFEANAYPHPDRRMEPDDVLQHMLRHVRAREIA
jgi:peroxiredoxin